MESGKRVIPTEKLLDLANFFNVSIDYLLGYTNNKTPRSKDLKDLLKEESMTYGGREISEDDLYTISKVVGALLDKKGIDR